MTFEKLVDEVQGSIEYKLGDLIFFVNMNIEMTFQKKRFSKQSDEVLRL